MACTLYKGLKPELTKGHGSALCIYTTKQLLVWDATCPDTFAPSYSGNATRGAGLVAAAAEERKEAKYTGLI